MKTLSDLFMGGLRDIYYAEKAISKELPKMVLHASDEDLKSAFEKHLEETMWQITRLEEAFEILWVAARGEKCPAIDGLLEEAKELMDNAAESEELMNAALTVAAQKVEHYEIGTYNTLIAQAQALWHDDVSDLLEANVEEEENMSESISGLEDDIYTAVV